MSWSDEVLMPQTSCLWNVALVYMSRIFSASSNSNSTNAYVASDCADAVFRMANIVNNAEIVPTKGMNNTAPAKSPRADTGPTHKSRGTKYKQWLHSWMTKVI